MKHNIVLLLLSFILMSFYCEGLKGLLESERPLRKETICMGDIVSIEESEIPCTTIDGDLLILNTNLHTLGKYSEIETIHGSVIIERNSVLNNLNNLQAINYVEQDFIANDNDVITEAEVRRIVNKILNDNEGYIGGNIIYNDMILSL